MKTILIASVLLLFATATVAAPVEEATELKTLSGTLHGTLLIPDAAKAVPVALIISGSGPTDRNGNSAMLPGPNDSLKMLASALAGNGIASLRYDKRGIGESKTAAPAESDLRFETYVDDAAAWVVQLANDHRFSGVTIIGHSEGSLIGIVAAQKGRTAGFVSIAGAGRRADALIRSQLATKLPAEMLAASNRTLDELVKGKTVDDAPKELAALFRPSVQPYLISWFRYDPAREIAKLKVPVLIIQGTTDIQVNVDEARALASGNPKARLLIVDGMNHILKHVDGDMKTQIASYSDPSLALEPALPKAISEFIGRTP